MTDNSSVQLFVQPGRNLTVKAETDDAFAVEVLDGSGAVLAALRLNRSQLHQLHNQAAVALVGLTSEGGQTVPLTE